MGKKNKTARQGPSPIQAWFPESFNFKLWAISGGIIIFTWALLYFPNLRSAPRWYGDELITLMAGDSIWNGTFANRALRYSFFSGHTNYQPPACFLYAAFSHIFAGGDIVGARYLAILLGLLTSLTAFHLLFLRGLIVEAISAAFIILAAPQSVIHFRWIYPHYFVSIAVVIIGLTLDQPRTPRRDWIIGLACGLAATAHLLFINLTLASLLVRWRYPSAWLRIILPPAVVISLALGFSYLICGRQLFLDLYEVYLLYTQHNDANGNSLLLKALTFWRFFTFDWLDFAYLVGLIVLFIYRRWALCSFVLLFSCSIIQNRPELVGFYYQAMTFAPLLGVCLACAILAVYKSLAAQVPEMRNFKFGPYLAGAILPLVLLPSALYESFTGDIVSRNDYYVNPSDPDLEATAAWVNSHTDKNDFVVAFWDWGWLLKCRWTDMHQCAIWEYGNCPQDNKRMRDHSEFLFPAEVRDARYVVVTALDLRWCYLEGTAPRLVQEANLSSWPVVAKSNTTLVLANPKFLTKVGGP